MKFKFPKMPQMPEMPDFPEVEFGPELTPQQIERCIAALERLAKAADLFANKWHA